MLGGLYATLSRLALRRHVMYRTLTPHSCHSCLTDAPGFRYRSLPGLIRWTIRRCWSSYLSSVSWARRRMCTICWDISLPHSAIAYGRSPTPPFIHNQADLSIWKWGQLPRTLSSPTEIYALLLAPSRQECTAGTCHQPVNNSHIYM